ncbi:MAG: MFS transporter [Clostridia bacterium]|nr:MFS transporter [Clostridia bacterium]
MDTVNKDYQKGFIPYAVAAAALSLCGGLMAAVPSNMVADWQLAESNVAWLAMAYSLGAAATAPILGKLADILGRRKTLLLGLILLTAGFALTAVIPDGMVVPVMVLRFLSGVGAAGISPVVLSYIMTEFPQEKLGKGFTLYMLISCGMVIFGPALGSVLLVRSGWRVVLYTCTAVGVFALLACLFLTKREEGARRNTGPFDYTGAALVLVFFSMLLFIPTFGQNNGWLAVPTLLCIAVGAVSLVLLYVTERKAQNPILNGQFIARKQFLLPVIALFLSQGLLQSCMTNIITFAIVTTGDRTLSGIATSILYVGMALGTVVIGPLADKREPRTVAAVALVFVALGAALQLRFTADTGLLLTGAAMFLIGLGLGGNGTIFLKVVLSGLPQQLAGSGSGTYNVFRDMSTPFGVAVFVPLFSRRLADGTALRLEQGIGETAARTMAAVEAIQATALVQVVSVAAGIAVCLMLPKIYNPPKAS